MVLSSMELMGLVLSPDTNHIEAATEASTSQTLQTQQPAKHRSNHERLLALQRKDLASKRSHNV